MPDLDRAAYLEHVASHLHLDPETEAEVLDELRTHIDDSTQTLMLDGYARDDAERLALRVLGDPDTLADSLRRAHRGTGRLLAAVGGGVQGAAEGAGRGFAAIVIVMLVAAFLGFVLAFAILAVLPDTTGFLTHDGPLDSLLRLVLAVPIACGGARRATAVVAREARQPIGRAAVAVGVIGGLLVAATSSTVLRPWTDLGSALIAVGIVVAWSAGAASVGRISEVRISRRAWLALVVGVALLYVVDMVQVAEALNPTSRP